MTTYDLGDGIPLEFLVTDRARQPTDATVTLSVIKPSGVVINPAITHAGVGRYEATPVGDVVNQWSYLWQATGAVTAVSAGTFVVADPAPALYADFMLTKSALGKMTNDDRDDLIEQAISAASRWIDRRTGRRFYADRTATARTFQVLGGSHRVGREQLLLVDDIASVEDLAVATGSTGNWVPVQVWSPGPDNAIAYGRPITEIAASSGWLPASGRVQVTARWGWPAVPDEIAQAAQLLAARLYRRKDSPQGVLGSTEWGTARVSRTDPDVENLIAPFVIPVIA